jgi:hypothetical protein
MIIVDCPLCEAPTPFLPETGSLDCEACTVHLDLADEAVDRVLPAAA